MGLGSKTQTETETETETTASGTPTRNTGWRADQKWHSFYLNVFYWRSGRCLELKSKLTGVLRVLREP